MLPLPYLLFFVVTLKEKIRPNVFQNRLRRIMSESKRAVNLGFLDRSRYFFIQVAHETEWTPFQTPYFSENLEGPGIEPGSSGSVARNSDQ
jgi:hypothetical protein